MPRECRQSGRPATTVWPGPGIGDRQLSAWPPRTSGFRRDDRNREDRQPTRCGLSLLFEAAVQVTRLGRHPDTLRAAMRLVQ